jgi:hypothetical protein
MAGAGFGGEAASALGNVYAVEQSNLDTRDKRYEQILDRISKGDTGTARALSEQYDIEIPETLYADGTLAKGLVIAGKLYGNGNEDRATVFIKEFQNNGGDWESAMRKAGPPRYTPPKVSRPRGNVELGSD